MPRTPQTAGGSLNRIWFRSGDINEIGIFVTDHPIVYEQHRAVRSLNYECRFQGPNPPGIGGSRHRWVARVPTAQTSYYDILLKSLKYVEARVSRPLPADCASTLTPDAGCAALGSAPNRATRCTAPGLGTPRRLRTVRLIPMPTPPEGRGGARRVQQPQELSDLVFLRQSRAREGSHPPARRAAASRMPTLTTTPWDPIHQYNPADVIRGVRDDYRNPLVNERFDPPHPNVRSLDRLARPTAHIAQRRDAPVLRDQSELLPRSIPPAPSPRPPSGTPD